ncbi:hypothetical protein N7539_008191 [Penicillium diatomitis]|uniref:DUF7707 domain-containing protein n=1 Tax=Penicillium diatomitis TaxID=2819901 RepID=A0A9W9WTB6_9EURO|nr:uncharacterized protein N7539_008191 [Penicillium diatomitis]KAJ5475125.1 hypothetical protein N7539_008191 [Penicillium diatomitis]
MLSRLLLALASTAALVSSQSIDPSTVPIATRQYWCNQQESVCPLLCLQISTGKPVANDCDAKTLDYHCICSNNITPNASQYSETMPYFICTEANNQCVNRCSAADSSCQSLCRTQHPCGAQNPIRVNVTTTASTSTASMTATGSNTATGTGTSGASGAAQSHEATGGSARVQLGEISQIYGLGVLVAGVAAGFAGLL